jgi:hypothetical protein
VGTVFLYGTGAWRNSSLNLWHLLHELYLVRVLQTYAVPLEMTEWLQMSEPWNLPYKHCRKDLANWVGVQHKYLVIRYRWNNEWVLCVSPYNGPWRSRGRVNVHLYSFFNFGARWWVDGQLHAPLSVPLERRLGRPHCWSGWLQNISPPPGFSPQIVQPIVSHCDWKSRLFLTDWCTVQLLVNMSREEP